MDLLPGLLVSNEKHSEKQTALTFYCLSDERFKTLVIPELNNKHVLTSAYGWLLLMDKDTNNSSLWNPSTTEIIELPVLENLYMYDRYMLSKPPTDPECYILFVCHYPHDFAFCRPGDDEFVIESTDNGLHDGRLLTIQGFASLRGEIYSYAEEKGRSCFKMVRFTGKTVELIPIFTWDEYPFAFLKIFLGLRMEYLVNSACGPEIFLLSEIKRNCRSYEAAGLDFKIFRVNLDKKECLELDNIGNQAIFLSHQEFGDNIFSCSSTKIIMANSIYYTIPNSKNLYRYSLDDRSHTNMLPFTSTASPKSYWVEYEVFKNFVN